ncbi:transcription factor IIA subunit alpha [Rhizoclosmatium sp. JEL0117]|nr:transcription factor IIA subunit alpha [Rhizoclosmatium sp. JEL0117]
MSHTTVPTVYTWIVDDVVTKVRPQFQAMGLSEQTLSEIEKKWMDKLRASKCASFGVQHGAHPLPQQQQQLHLQQQQQQQQQHNNVNYTTQNLFQNPMYAQSQPQIQQQQQQQAYPQQPQYFPQDNDFLNANPYSMQHHQPQQPATAQNYYVGMNGQMQLPPLTQMPQIPQYARSNTNNLGGYQLPQNDGSADDVLTPPTNAHDGSRNESDSEISISHRARIEEIDALLIPILERNKEHQMDEVGSNVPHIDLANAKEITDASEKKRVLQRVFKGKRVLGQNDGEDDEDDDDEEDDENNRLGSDLDSKDDESEDEPDFNNLILCQYEKVNRTKNKWKCVFKDGIVHVHGKDYLFHKGTADFEW